MSQSDEKYMHSDITEIDNGRMGDVAHDNNQGHGPSTETL